MKKYIILAIIALLHNLAFAQSLPTPGPRQSQPILLKNATLHIGNGTQLATADLLMVDGKIAEVGTIKADLSNTMVIDLSGKHVYPGLIAPNTQIGLSEIEAVRATNDFAETGEVNPNVRALIAYNTDSRVTPTVRSNGILLTQVTPTGGLFSGTSSIVQLDAWNWEDAAYLPDEGVHLNWPRMRFNEAPWAPPVEEQKKQARENQAKLDEAIAQAKAYHAARLAGIQPQTDLRWEALIPVLEKQKPLYIHAQDEKQIEAAVAFAQTHDLRMVLVGGADAWRVAELLKRHQIPVILQKPHSLPTTEDDAVDQMYRIPKLLKDAGVKFCLSHAEFWNQRNLPFLAGTAVAYGLTKDEALSAITLHAAEILGIADRTGSLEVGKDANIIVSTGDLLDMRSSHIEMAWIQGRAMDLGSHQKDMYQKYKSRK